VEEVCEAAGSPCAGVELGEVQLSDLSLDLDARYIARRWGPLEPYAGAGAGLHLVNGGGGFIDNTFVEDILDAITPGINAMTGVQLPLGRGLRLHGELRGVVAGGANWIGAGLGGSITLPTRRAPSPEVRP
jgi:opacity protein-like surface antigen